jgi:hypothetical protein
MRGGCIINHNEFETLDWLNAGHTGGGSVAEFAGFDASGAAVLYSEANYTLVDGTRAFTGNVSFGDNNITNVGDISLDRILSDAGTTITVVLGTDAGDDLIVGNNNAFVVEGDTDYIGIGILAPIGRFQVAQSGTFPSGANTAIFDNAQSQTDFNFSYANALFMNSNATTNNWAKFTFTGNADGTNGSGGIGFQFTDRVNNYGNWGFYTNAADGFLDRFHIKSDGCIGINQSLPTAMLHIVPNATTVEGIFIKAPGSYNADFLSLQDSLGNELITFTAGGGAVFNENGNDADFRIEGDTDANLFILDAGLDLIGLGRVPTTYLLEVGRDQNAATVIQTINANAVDTGATSGFFALASTANLIALAHGDGRTTTRYGVTIGGYAELVTTAGEGLLIGTGALNKPIIFGTNDVERWRILGGGGLQSNAAEKLLFRDSAIGIYSQADTYMDFFADGGMRFGDSSAGAPTNYVEIESDGDINFVAGAGLQHGCVNYHGAGVNTTCTVQNTWYQITAFDNNSESNGSVTPDHTNDHITVGKAGAYQIFLGMGGASTTANNTFEVSVFINNGATQITPITIHETFGVANQTRTGSMLCQAELSANDTVEAWVRCTSGAGKVYTTDHAVLNVIQIRGFIA